MATGAGVAKKYGVLIIEDDEKTRTLMSRIITSAGFEVREAALAADGLKAVDETIDLVIVDIGLPDYDGQNLVSRLRRHFAKSRLKICFASALTEKETVRKSLEVGGDDYIVKPIDKDLLLQKVTKLLGQATPQFAWVGAECAGKMLESRVLPNLKVVRLSESGLLIRSPSRFLVGTHIKLDCPGLTAAIQQPFHEVIQRVTSCERIGKSYFIATEFAGLSEIYVQPLRGLAIRGKIITDTNEAVQKSLEVGGDDYIAKPIDKDILLQKISKILEQTTSQFAWTSVECVAEILESSVLPDLKIVRLSESGLLIRSSSRFLVGTHIKLDCPGITAAIQQPFHEVIQRVTSCERIGKSYFVATEFAGLSEIYVQPLRGLAIRGKLITTTNAAKAS